MQNTSKNKWLLSATTYTLQNKGALNGSSTDAVELFCFDKETFSQRLFKEPSLPYILHLADTFIQSDLQCIQAIHLYCQYVCSLGNKPSTFVLLTQCSTTEPQEHLPFYNLKNLLSPQIWFFETGRFFRCRRFFMEPFRQKVLQWTREAPLFLRVYNYI